ncbi:carboxymuconolactone decarboxylase family protein [Corallococcus sp. H22C18031201]|uniref:carboxymuconolactone decarboxylase family protein n=1 Tax=Citreicoccus inhibens TaxID=2849499 RepID=UPI000E7085FD|nr:carboxymuconolactone decarboxylase family protein [Citreicoccus inhibens]MBU8897791.1 carboxymuconolactone decarboxylase family protein [Citreicoccus inhibens]RJS25686.1 carboxymuconolactone decarboxylase family protein [Corallococcus sp. H22C18031201]
MSSNRIPPKQITGLYGAIVKMFAQRMFGLVPKAFGVLWHNLPVLKAQMGFSQKLHQWRACDESLKSYAHIAVASLVGCSFCLDLNYFMARNKGLDLDKAQQVPQWRQSNAFNLLEQEVLEYAEAMSQTPPRVTDEMVASLRAQLGDSALIELTSIIGFAQMTTRTNTALGIEAEGFSAACGLKPKGLPSAQLGVVSAS